MMKINIFQKFSSFIFAYILFAASVFSVGSAQAYELEGQFIQGGMVRGQVEGIANTVEGVANIKVSEIWLGDSAVKIGPNGYFVFGFLRDQAKETVLKFVYEDGTTSQQVLEITPQNYNIERVDGLPPRTVDIPEGELARRRLERGKVAVARAGNNNELFWRQSFIRPAEGRISGVYGSQRILNGSPRTPHYGLDVAAPVGTRIVAPAGGVVTLAEADFLLEGGIVIIDHGFSIFSTLFHMNSVAVSEGQVVEQGEPIGTIGAKGRASGPHVDWRINWGNVRLDPKLLLEE